MSKYMQVVRLYTKDLGQGFIAKVPDDMTPAQLKTLVENSDEMKQLIADSEEEEYKWYDGGYEVCALSGYVQGKEDIDLTANTTGEDEYILKEDVEKMMRYLEEHPEERK